MVTLARAAKREFLVAWGVSRVYSGVFRLLAGGFGFLGAKGNVKRNSISQ